ncbi:MAG: prepilin-type N-terminal cleavage/methylation domain-containing protein [Rhodoferax sp.]|nr:prepilin-type N-terminal cleavage/methylation domain-containing protein [Rhodoferax sp.]
MDLKHAVRVRIRAAGLTLVELMLVLMLIGVLAAIAMPMYANYRERINRATAVQDIRILQLLIADYAASGGTFPTSLADVGNGGKLDPWGQAYQYVDLTAIDGHGKARKDHKFNPINTSFDLYSMGKDGVSRTQLTQKDSLDDIVRARDGAFVGLASDFSS